jgi:TRAP-type C4-dicarboxylate transport system permease small subunit
MNFLERFSKQLSKVLYWIAGISIISMMLLTCADILLRLCVTFYHKYNIEFLSGFKPIPGTYELVCFMGAVAVSFAMAHTSVEKGHVAVSLLVRLFPQRVQALIGFFTNSFSFIFFALISWRSYIYGNHLREIGEVSLTLQLPFFPFVYGIAFSAIAVCLVVLVDLINNLGVLIGVKK